MLNVNLRSRSKIARRQTLLLAQDRVTKIHTTTGSMVGSFSGNWTSFGTAMTLPSLPNLYNYFISFTIRKASGLLTIASPSTLEIRARWTDGTTSANINPKPTMPVMANMFYSESFFFTPGEAPANATTLVLQFIDDDMADIYTWTGSYTIVAIPKLLSFTP